jgi:hypothetical protein
VTNTPSNNPQLVSANAAAAASAASNSIGIIVGSATGGALLGVIGTLLVAYHMANRPRRIASPPLFPVAHTAVDIPPPYFQEEQQAPQTMITRPRTFTIPPINNQKIPKFASSRTTFNPLPNQTANNPFMKSSSLQPPPPPPPADE